MEDWVRSEFSLMKLGDVRVDESAKKIIDKLASKPGCAITEVFETSSEVKACYEFFHNGKVSPEKILDSHKKATLNRIKSEAVVLLPQDTSSLDYSSKDSIEGRGNISAKNNQGFFLHPLLAITPSRVNLGIVDAKIWAREQRVEKLTREEIYALPLEEKEGFRWAESYKIACKIAEECPNTQIITMTDREGDFAELYEIVEEFSKNEKSADIIVRGCYDRALIGELNAGQGIEREEITEEEKNDIEDEIKIKDKLIKN